MDMASFQSMVCENYAIYAGVAVVDYPKIEGGAICVKRGYVPEKRKQARKQSRRRALSNVCECTFVF
jgi:hypothetical protein